MAYYNTYKRRPKSKFTKRKNYKRKLKSGLVSQLVREFRLMKKNIEKKAITYYYTNSASQVDASTGAIASLMTQVGQGVDNQSRIGNIISNMYIQYNSWCYIQTAQTLRGQGALDIVLDRAPTGSLPTVASIFTATAPDRLVIFSQKKRFKVLAHHHFTYATGTIDDTGVAIEGFKKLKFNTVYTGNSGTITDLTNGKNDILIIFRSSNNALGLTSYYPSISVRVCFTDS